MPLFLVRVIGVLAMLAIAAGIVAYIFTGNRAHLRTSWRIAKYAIIFLLVIFGLMAAERLI